jgi:hypothetical protein
MDKYYTNVEINMELVFVHPKMPTYVTNRLKFVYCDIEEMQRRHKNIEWFGHDHFHSHPSYFSTRKPKSHREVEEIRNFNENIESVHVQLIQWRYLLSFLIN